MKLTKSTLKQIIKEEFDAYLREAELGPEYNIPLKIGLGTYNIFQQYWEGQGDPLYALLSRRGDTPSIPVVDASEEEVERLGEVAEEIIEANEDPMHVRVAEATLEDIKKAARSDMLPKLQQIIKEELKSLMEINVEAARQETTLDEKKEEKWIQGAEKDIERRGTEGVCTGDKFGGPTCRPGTKRYNLAKTFRKMAKDRQKE